VLKQRVGVCSGCTIAVLTSLVVRSINCCDRMCGWNGCKRYPPKFSGREIVVERAADPTNILWEHIQFSTCNRVLRELLTTVVVLILIFGGSYVSVAVFATFAVTLLMCWCCSYVTALVKSPEATSPGHHHENVFVKWGIPSFLATIPLSVITVVINMLIKKVYVKLAEWETHHHISGQEEWSMVKMAFGQYMNVVFVQWYVHVSFMRVP